MIYNLENTIEIGKPQRVFDANGVEILFCIECDAETGRVEQFTSDASGDMIINHGIGEPLRSISNHPAPLRVEEA